MSKVYHQLVLLNISINNWCDQFIINHEDVVILLSLMQINAQNVQK